MKKEFSNVNPNMLSLAEIRKEAYQQGRADGFDYGVRKVAELLHEYDCIECKECPMYSECDDDCEIVLLRRLKEQSNEGMAESDRR